MLVSYASTKKCSLTDHIRLWGTSLPNPVTLLDWFVRGKGALTTVACEQGGFFRTRADAAQPDLQARASSSPCLVPPCASLCLVPRARAPNLSSKPGLSRPSAPDP